MDEISTAMVCPYCASAFKTAEITDSEVESNSFDNSIILTLDLYARCRSCDACFRWREKYLTSLKSKDETSNFREID